MSFSKDDALAVKNAFLSGAAALDNKKDWINELNVFPVPDGDTGTNMTLTIMNAANELSGLQSNSMEDICKVIKNGSLRGARGNSGVILSQLLSGFTKGILEREAVEVSDLSYAFQKAVDTAYKAVMKPKEGTILTVARAMSDEALNQAGNFSKRSAFIDAVLKAGEDMLARTPDMLPVLKEAGVVDAGGQGLMVIMHGALDALRGNGFEFKGLTSATVDSSVVAAASNTLETSDIKFGYCTEFIIDAFMSADQIRDFKAYLESIGDSIVLVADDDFVKVHVHSNEPGNVIQRGLSYGPLSRMKIDNMREEHNELFRNAISEKKKLPRKDVGVVSVSAGAGFSEIFTGLQCDRIITGGQTMNPSAEDIVKAIEETDADVVYVLPNNKNIILAAQQAAEIVETSRVVVVPTRSVCQGVIALYTLDFTLSPEENIEVIDDTLQAVKTCEVTYAVRDTSIDGFVINTDDIMAIGDRGMIAVGADIDGTVFQAFEKLISSDSQMVTVYYGDSITEEEAGLIIDKAKELYPQVDFSLNYGGQPVYFYMISVE